jgi:hypothetical protein
MTNLILISQITVAVSVYFVWIFRYFNVVAEFQQFGLNDITRNFIGASKISLSALLLVSIWYPELITVSAGLMGFLMIAAQYFHFKVKNPFIKHLPSLLLLCFCIFLVLASSGKL